MEALGKCANCLIPLTSFCVRNKLSTKFSSVGLSSCDQSIHEIFSQFFKLKQTVVNGLNVKDLELCRYCTSNFCKLVKAYRQILLISNETGSTFSKIIVQSKGRPGRPPKNQNVSKDSSVLNSSISSTINAKFDVEEDEVEEAQLQYLGLTRKRRAIASKNYDEVGSHKRSKKAQGNDVDAELLFPEVNLVTDDPVHANRVNDDEEDEDPPIVQDLETTDINNDPTTTRFSGEQSGELSPNFSCKYCAKNFKHPQRLQQHLKTHHETLKDDETYNDEEEILTPQKRKQKKTATKFHPNINKKRGRPPKSSSNDTTKSSSSTSTEKSKKTAKSLKGGHKEDYVCKVCKKQFKLQQLLKQHMKVSCHSKCEECDKKFKSAALLKRHSQVHKKDSVFKCEDCDREFPNLLGLQVHAVAHTRQLFTCKGCKRKFKIEKNFIQHQETARCTEKKHPCPVETCGKLFKNKDKVKRHLISMHSEKKPFTCELCSKGFRSQADLKFHEVNAHICGETKQYVCEHCGKRFKSLETLKSHEMYSHKMEKKHFCPICAKGFPLLATLKIHEISHSTDRPHMCSYCGRTYKHANDLKSHEVVHYRDEEKPFVCPICSKRYHRKDVLRLHQGREKHFAPDVPVPLTARKLASVNTKPKRLTGTKGIKTSSEDHAMHVEGEEYFESGDSNSSIISPSLSLPLPTQAGPTSGVTVSVVQNLSTHPHSHVVFSQTNLNAGPGMQILTSPTTQHHHLVPIMHHSNVVNGSHHPQQHGNISQPSFNVAPVNEAISDFYRIMYDLS